MGARAQEQLAMSFLTVVMELWARSPSGVYKVEEVEDDLVPALAQICIKSLAADLRDGAEASRMMESVCGEVHYRDGTIDEYPKLRTVANKIIHGVPERVEVQDGDVRLFYVNHESATTHEKWSEMWVSGPSAIEALSRNYKHQHKAPSREQAITKLLGELGPNRIPPKPLFRPRENG